MEIPDHGALCDILWSDPIDEKQDRWVSNKMRSCSYYYSHVQASMFLKTNKIKMIIRGHEVQMKGFKYQYDPKNEPISLTIFSAPKYCDSYNNKGAIAIIKVYFSLLRKKRYKFVVSKTWSILLC